MQQTERFDNVYVSPRVRVALHSVLDAAQAKKFWDLVNKLRSGLLNTPGLRVERLHTRRGKVYSARINIELRVIFSMYANKQTGKRSLVLWDANHHDAAYERVDRAVIPMVFDPPSNFLEPETAENTDTASDSFSEGASDDEDLTNGLMLFRVPYYVLAHPERYKSFEKNADRYLRLSEEQEELLGKTDRAYLIRGSAGTGKTSLALFYALHINEQFPEDNVYFFTYHDELACVCRSYKDNLIDESSAADQKGEFSVFSYIQFCRHYLRNHPDVKRKQWTWIDQATGLKHLTEIINSRTRWSRSLDAPHLYNFIYSILKGRFVPGTDRLPTSADDFRRVLKGYGNLPAKLEDILEVFGHYEERLSMLKQKDEADLIRICYEEFKNKATIGQTDSPTWIVIDEIQDFTELEWKSILLFWKAQCTRATTRTSYPFLCGDKNQNISSSGFRWPDLDSYVESTLRTIHRPNAVEKIQLHRNYRNTKQIFDLGVFVHSFAPHSGGDMGLPPEGIGNKPRLVIGDSDLFATFLQSLDEPYDETMPAPMVVLYEDPHDIKRVQTELRQDHNLFLMPLYSSKGMEFEDLLLYRPFSSLTKIVPDDSQDEYTARLFDLWYMAVTRARHNLLLFMTADDLAALQKLLGDSFSKFMELVECKPDDDQLEQLRSFYQGRERYLPNYAIVFLERVKAAEIWQQYQAEVEKNAAAAETLKSKALTLWKRCRDVSSLGKAYMELHDHNAALEYLEQAGDFVQLAQCCEKLDRFEEAARYYYYENQPLDAARCYEAAQQFLQAAEILDAQLHWPEAATNWQKAGENLKAAQAFEKAEMWQQAADLFKLKSNWLKAAELYQNCERYQAAAEMFLKVKDKLDAARCFGKASMPERAAPIYEGLMRWSEAGQSYEEMGDFDKAGAMYSKAGKLKDVARCKESAGDLVSAAAAYERMKQWEKAADAYVLLDEKSKAAECYENGQHWESALSIWMETSSVHNAARCLDRLGRAKEAAELYAESDSPNESGHCFEKIEKWADAADQYLKANNHAAAASMLARLGRKLDAARLYVLSGQAGVAVELLTTANHEHGEKLLAELVEWADQSDKVDLSASLYEAKGDYAEAIQRYRSAMKWSKAAACAEKDKQFGLAGELYLQDGRFDNAAICFYTANRIAEAARCYENLKRWHDARRLYEQIGDQEGIRRCETAANWL